MTSSQIAVCLLATMTGCDREGVQTHEIAKGVERVPEAAVPAAAPESPRAGDLGTSFPWTVPDGWALDPAPRQMRLATYTVPDPSGRVEVAVTRFPGRVGGELANINRWRGQMGLGPLGEGELDSAVTRFASPGYEGYETRTESTGGVMLAAGVYDAGNDQTWFIRATVTDAKVADRIQPDLFGMARSIVVPTDGGDG